MRRLMAPPSSSPMLIMASPSTAGPWCAACAASQCLERALRPGLVHTLCNTMQQSNAAWCKRGSPHGCLKLLSGALTAVHCTARCALHLPAAAAGSSMILACLVTGRAHLAGSLVLGGDVLPCNG